MFLVFVTVDELPLLFARLDMVVLLAVVATPVFTGMCLVHWASTVRLELISFSRLFLVASGRRDPDAIQIFYYGTSDFGRFDVFGDRCTWLPVSSCCRYDTRMRRWRSSSSRSLFASLLTAGQCELLYGTMRRKIAKSVNSECLLQ
jgi:hypothetical protein